MTKILYDIIQFQVILSNADINCTSFAPNFSSALSKRKSYCQMSLQNVPAYKVSYLEGDSKPVYQDRFAACFFVHSKRVLVRVG